MLKKLAVLLLAIIMLFQGIVITAFAEKTNKEQENIEEVQEGEEGESEDSFYYYPPFEIQYILKRYGYFTASLTDYFGEITQAAVDAFAKDSGLEGESEDVILAAIHAAGCTTAKVNVRSQLYIREQPDSQSEVIDVVSRASAVFIYFERDGWYYVETENGMTGYVLTKYLTKGELLGITGKTVDIDGVVNIRQSADITSEIVGKLENDKEVQVISGSGDWFKIRYGQKEGYIFKKYISIGSEHGAATVLGDAFAAWTGSAKSSLNLRANPSTSATKISTVSKGTTFSVIGQSGDWYYIKLKNGTKAYAHKDYVKKGTSYTTCTVTGITGQLNIRKGPGTDQKVVATVKNGTVLSLLDDSSSWYKVKTAAGTIGYIDSKYAKLGGNLYSGSSSSGSSGGNVSSTPVDSNAALGVQIAQYAQNFLGRPYYLGATGPNRFDCSGFTYYVYKHFGITLLRTAYQQGYQQKGQKITSKSDLIPGDLVFFNTKMDDSDLSDHAGIYIGNGKFIHASSGSAHCVVISDLSSNYYKTHFSWGRRIV